MRGLPHAERYLEIGVEKGYTIENIDIASRWGVDPAPGFDLSRLPRNLNFFKGTSDEFFAQLAPASAFDVVFLDGLHTFEQTHTDLLNAFAHLHNGALLVDDTVPSDETSAIRDWQQSLERRRELGLEGLELWHGDVWKVVVCLARYHPELDFRTIMGSGNPQTLVWRKNPAIGIAQPDADAVSEVAALSYSDVFGNGLPAMFKPRDEADALSECLTAVAPRASGLHC